MRKLILMQGPSGSGKTTWAAQQVSFEKIASADYYFTSRDGSYRFDASLLGEAHKSCRDTIRRLLNWNTPCVIVDNTNTTADEISWYYYEAIDRGWEVEIVRIQPKTPEEVDLIFARNRHNVPASIITVQLNNIWNFWVPDYWKTTITEIPMFKES